MAWRGTDTFIFAQRRSSNSTDYIFGICSTVLVNNISRSGDYALPKLDMLRSFECVGSVFVQLGSDTGV